MKQLRQGRPMGEPRSPVERRLREAMEIRQVPGYLELGEVAGVSRSVINQICAKGSGHRETFRRLAAALYVSPEWLRTGRTDDDPTTLEREDKVWDAGEVRTSPRRAGIPILGHIAGGRPIWAADPQAGGEVLDVQAMVGGAPEATFALRVQGSSMREVGILDGTIVIARRDLAPAPGDICVCSIGEHATVKRVWDEGESWRLEPENVSFSPEWVEKNSDVPFRIWGKVVGWFHALEG